MSIETLLVVVAVLLFLIFVELRKIGSRLKNRFPTEKEQDYEWSQKDPMGHWEAHKKKTNEAGGERFAFRLREQPSPPT